MGKGKNKYEGNEREREKRGEAGVASSPLPETHNAKDV